MFTPIGWIPEPEDDRAAELEKALHERFAAHRHRCEWFHAHDDLLDYILHNCEPWPYGRELQEPRQ